MLSFAHPKKTALLTGSVKGFWLMVLLLVPISLRAQHSIQKDSLRTVKNVYEANEEIQFVVKLNKKAKKGAVRQIETMSCSCGDWDFYYIVYEMPDFDKKLLRTEFVNHTEKADTERCTCKLEYAQFKDGQTRAIAHLKKPGYYMIVIEGYGFKMSSNVFEVKN